MPVKKKPASETSSASRNTDECPWTGLDQAGSGLSVDHFITTEVVRTANALRRTVTYPYAEKFSLTMAEWRMLSVLAQAGSLPFSEMVRQSATDKSLVSRTLKSLEQRGLVALEALNGGYRQGLICKMTDDGNALYAQAMPVARSAQAAMIRVLTETERKVLFRALRKLRKACGDSGDMDV